MDYKAHHIQLRRDLGLFGATMMGLGSILGSGVFVSIGIAAGITGPSVVFAIALAALVATCNALSSAQLAAKNPVSGGTYEYGYRYLHPSLGFTAGGTFLCAKSASAATAALGFAGYFLHLFGNESLSIIPIAIGIIILLTVIILSGLKRSNLMSIIMVSLTLVTLILFVLLGIPNLLHQGYQHVMPIFPMKTHSSYENFFRATALMFVAYTGYARVATLAEEVKNPKNIIPRAIILTLIISAILYISVSFIAISAVGAKELAQITQSRATPLKIAAEALKIPGLSIIIAIGACIAMLSVLLNLSLGLSRVVLAMGRKGDLPNVFSHVTQTKRIPSAAIIGVGVVIILLALTGSVEITWTFSAFTVLIYYFLTNLAALRMPKEDRLYSLLFPIFGLISCIFLAFCVPVIIWGIGLGLIILGLVWQRYVAVYFKDI